MPIGQSPGFDPPTREHERRALIDLRRSEGRLRREAGELANEVGALRAELNPVQLTSGDISSIDSNLTLSTITQTERIGRLVVFNILVKWDGPLVGADLATKLVLAPEWRPRANAGGFLLVSEDGFPGGFWNVTTNGVLTFPRGSRMQMSGSAPHTVRLTGSWVT